MELGIGTVANQDTRQRLLEAAGEVFAKQGYRKATVREICEKARANVAAINYHFGGKERLYAEVLHYACRCASNKYPIDMGVDEAPTGEGKLRAFVRAHFMRLFDPGRPRWQAGFIVREMQEPSKAFDRLVETEIRPAADLLGKILREMLGREVPEERLRLVMLSIVSQVMMHNHSRKLIEALFSGKSYGFKNVEYLTQHVVRFSLGGLEDVAQWNGSEDRVEEKVS